MCQLHSVCSMVDGLVRTAGSTTAVDFSCIGIIVVPVREAELWVVPLLIEFLEAKLRSSKPRRFSSNRLIFPLQTKMMKIITP